ncbi:MAG: DUF4157 domain-containing protein [Heliobacteriaceae bacterium]|nr:DUF4157 domain-containing protein [Heliobacteriaceae bacterium]
MRRSILKEKSQPRLQDNFEPGISYAQESTVLGNQDVLKMFAASRKVRPDTGTNKELPKQMKAKMEAHFGFDLSDVAFKESPEVTAMGAKAYTKGNVIKFAPGQFSPDTMAGRQMIGHELAHVVQQARGGIKANIAGSPVNFSESLENIADREGGRAAAAVEHIDSAPVSALAPLPALDAAAAPVQGLFGGIKKFFNKISRGFTNIKNQFKFGRALNRKDQYVKSELAKHAAAQADIRAKTGPDDQIGLEMALLDDRRQKSDQRGSTYQGLQSDMMIGTMLNDPNEMDSGWARLGRGALTQKSRNKREQREQDFLANVAFGRPEEQRYEQLRQERSSLKESAGFYSSRWDASGEAMKKAVVADTTMTPEKKAAFMESVDYSRGVTLLKPGDDQYNAHIIDLLANKKVEDIDREIIAPYFQRLSDFNFDEYAAMDDDTLLQRMPELYELFAPNMRIFDMARELKDSEGKSLMSRHPEASSDEFSAKSMLIRGLVDRGRGLQIQRAAQRTALAPGDFMTRNEQNTRQGVSAKEMAETLLGRGGRGIDAAKTKMRKK